MAPIIRMTDAMVLAFGRECGKCKNLEKCEMDPSEKVLACSDYERKDEA